MENRNYTGPIIMKSYTVELRRGKPTVEPSGWLPGYTEAHKATIVEAIQYAIAKTEGMILQLQANVDDLEDKLGLELARAVTVQAAGEDADDDVSDILADL